MTFDIAHHLGAVTRTVGSGERDGRSVQVVIATRTYDTDPADLWDALTNQSRIPRWFLPISGDLRLGGHYQFEGNAGGQITRCEAPRHLAVTWEYGGEGSWVIVELTAIRTGGTLLALEHVALVDNARWDRYGPGAVGVGWDMALMGLARHLAMGAAVVPEEGIAWLSSTEGKDFVRKISDDWCRAAIAAGADTATAKAAAERTRAAYTGEVEPPAET